MYGKHFASMYEGSMVGAGPTVFAVWGYCIAKASGDDHTVLLNENLLSSIIGTTVPDIRDAIKYLTSPDPDSKNKDHEGRRLVPLSGLNYLVVSHEHYRNIKNISDVREYERERKRKQREKTKEKTKEKSTVPECPGPTGTPVSVSVSVSASSSGEESREGEPLPPPTPPPPEPEPKTFKQWNSEDLAKSVAEANNDGLLTPAEVKDFIGYWMEKSATGRSKIAYQQTWDTRRRMQTALRIIYSRSREGGGPRGFSQHNQPQPQKRYFSV